MPAWILAASSGRLRAYLVKVSADFTTLASCSMVAIWPIVEPAGIVTCTSSSPATLM